MSQIIGVMGPSGSGKTTSMRNLNPQTTYYIDADGKGLSWKGWKRQYSDENGNYARTSSIESINTILDQLPEQFNCLVIDTLNAVMVDDEMERAKQKGYDKWVDLAQSVYMLVNKMNRLRDNLIIVCLFHEETLTDEDGSGKLTRILTNGRKLQKIQLECKLPILLRSQCKRLADGSSRYVFQTQSYMSTAKSPMGLFDSFEIDNDMKEIVEAVRRFDTEE